MNSDYDVTDLREYDCNQVDILDLDQSSKDNYSYRLGYRYGLCMGNERGSDIGIETARRLIDEGSTESVDIILNRIMKDRRETFQQLIEENIRQDYSTFNENDKIVVRRNYEIPELTARGFIEGYRNNFEKSYRDSFINAYQSDIDAFSIGSNEARELVKKVADSEARTSGVISEQASRLGTRSALELTLQEVRRLASGDTSINPSIQAIERYLEETVSSELVDELIEEIPESDYRRNMEDNLIKSQSRFEVKYPTCDSTCLEQYREGFATTYMNSFKIELRKSLREEFDRSFERSFRESYQSTLDRIQEQISNRLS